VKITKYAAAVLTAAIMYLGIGFNTDSVSAAPAGADLITEITLNGTPVTDSDGNRYFATSAFPFADKHIPMKNGAYPTSVGIYNQDDQLLRELQPSSPGTYPIEDITGIETTVTNGTANSGTGYFAWYRDPSGKQWSFDLGGHHECTPGNSVQSYPPTECNTQKSERTITIDTLSTEFELPSSSSVKFTMDQVSDMQAGSIEFAPDICTDTCMNPSKVGLPQNISPMVDKKVTFDWVGEFDSGSSNAQAPYNGNGLVRTWYNAWKLNLTAKVYKHPAHLNIYAFYGTPVPVDPCIANPSGPGCGGGGGGSGSTGGTGKVKFDPNNTVDKDSPIIRGWARSNFTVTASVIEYVKAEQKTSVNWSKPRPCTPTLTGCSPNPPYTGTAQYYCWRDKEDSIAITGSYTGTNSVSISNEGYHQKLHGQVNWKPYQWRWDSPPMSGSTYSMPSCGLNPATIVGDSGFYNLDKTNPVHNLSMTSRNWTNQPITFNLGYTDNLSGFWGSNWKLSNISYYNPLGNENYTVPNSSQPGAGNPSPLSYSKSFTINKQGVYTLTTNLGDYAGWPMSSSTGPQQRFFSDYRYDSIAPYDTRYATGAGGVNKNGTFDYIADYGNTVKISVGDELSGVVNTKFCWSKRPDRNEPCVNDWGGSWNNVPIGTPDYATGANQFSNYIDININSKTAYNQNQASSYADLKEGAWYLHIQQTDRANNMTHSVSPQIWINKLKNLRINNITDFTWKNYFKNPDESDSSLMVNGITPPLMPMYYNKESRNISLGYALEYKLDSVGFNDPGDHIDVDIKYHALDKNNNYLKDVDVWVEDDGGNYIKLQDSKYSLSAKGFTYSSTQKVPYEPGITNNQYIQPMYNRETRSGDYSTYKNRTFLPPTTKFVKAGSPLDLVNKKDTQDYKVLVTYHVTSYSAGHPIFNYTAMEDTWANGNNWGTTNPNSYGFSRPSGLNMIGQGVNKGEVFFYDLQKTLLDDMKWFRTW
jgi:hypothetical protein